MSKYTARGRVHLDTTQLLKKVGAFENYGKILAPAMSKTKNKMRTVLSSQIRSMYAIKKADTDPSISVRYQTVPPSITATVKGRRFTLSRFMVGGIKRMKPVKVRVKKGSTETLGSPVFANTIKGRPQVMRRVGKGRLPVDVLRTISVAQMAANKSVYDMSISETAEVLFKQIEAQHKRFIEKLK